MRDYARVKVNGKELDGRGWQPYRWEITGALKPGANELEIQVNATSAGRGGLGPPSPATGGRAGAAPGAAPPAGSRRGAAEPPASGLLGPVRLVAR